MSRGLGDVYKRQVVYRRVQGGTAPKLTDTSTPGRSYELPAPWSEWIEEAATNVKIIK